MKQIFKTRLQFLIAWKAVFHFGTYPRKQAEKNKQKQKNVPCQRNENLLRKIEKDKL